MEISLYFHIPFCTKKCPYCHFYVIPNQSRYHTLLLEGLKLEWERQKPLLKDHTVVSIYFGGGTPSLLGADAIGQILSWCENLSPTCEITLEANPEHGTLELFSSYKKVGVNRISLGIQSLDDRSLQTLEREHSAKKGREAILNVKAAGFDNLSIDLMYDLPSQTESSWNYTLDQLESLPIDHLSLYNLTIEPHTSFFKRKETLLLPKPNESLIFLNQALDKLEKIGLHRYEISAFAKLGKESRHNTGYWTFRPFLGFGPSAFSYWEKERFQNIANLQRYHRSLTNGESPVSFQEKLPYPQSLKEELAVRLRLKSGAKLPSTLPVDTTTSIKTLIDQGFITKFENTIFLTELGRLFYDSVAAELM